MQGIRPTTKSNRPTSHYGRAGVLVLLSILCFLGFAEIGMRKLTPETQFLNPTQNAFWKAQLRQQLTRDEQVPPASSDISFDEALGWRMTPNYQQTGLHHNSKGYRGTREYQEHSDNPRILALGDSFTYGLGVTDEETYAHQIEQQTSIKVINTGVKAHTIEQSLLLWESEGQVLKPEFVILGYAVDKFFANGLTVRNLPKPYFLPNEDASSYLLNGVPVPTASEAKKNGLLDNNSGIKIIQATSWLNRKFKDKLGIIEDTSFRKKAGLNDFLLSALNQSVEKSGAKLIVAFIGHCFDGEPRNSLAEKAILSSCVANGIQCINMAEKMRDEHFNDYYGQNCHWSTKGHQFAAQEIAKAIKNHQ